ncbi:ABC transporter ATP-binding protein [Candidatus Bipolaricaulota sp. J31]
MAREDVKLEVVDLHKRFGRVVAVDGVSFAVPRGEILVLLGPSGCGKTTVLRLIAGLEAPDRGDVRIGGRSVLGLPPERRGVGLLFQSYALFPHMSVAGNVAYGLRFKGVPRRERARRVRELLELVGLAGYERRKPHELSHGQKQRVALARALAPEPEVLLLDEPLSALDAALRAELRWELRRILVEQGITSVYVTHDQEEGFALADRLGVMRAGRIEQLGPPEELYSSPKTPFVASFLGIAVLWPGVLRRGSGEAWVEAAGIRVPVQDRSIPDGSPVYLLLRPEDVAVGEGELEAVVERAEFRGDRWEVRARFRALPLTVFTSDRVAPGDAIRFRFERRPLVLERGS